MRRLLALCVLLVSGCAGGVGEDFADADLRVTSASPHATLGDEEFRIKSYAFTVPSTVTNVIAKLRYESEGRGSIGLETDSGSDLGEAEEFGGGSDVTRDPWAEFGRLDAGQYKLYAGSHSTVTFSFGLYWD